MRFGFWVNQGTSGEEPFGCLEAGACFWGREARPGAGIPYFASPNPK